MRNWHDIGESYRAEAWAECARLVRAHLDRDPHDLATRALLASLLLRSRQRSLALMQYERLLPLAVGQGHLFRALATQRRLDELHPPAHRHPDRYRAIQDWFLSLGGTPAGPAGAARADSGGEPPLSEMLALPAEAFSVIAERSRVVALDMAPHAIHEPAGVLWVVYFGQVRWTLVNEPGGAHETLSAGDGDVIRLRPGVPDSRWLEVEAESPCEVLQLDPGLITLLERARVVRERAIESDQRAGAPALEGTAAVTAPRPPARPRPDPIAEPTIAATAPRERRRGTRIAVMLENRVVLLGDEGTRVAPIPGRVVDISSGGLGLVFPAAQVRHSSGIQPQALVTLRVGLRDADEALRVTGRIAWIEWKPVLPDQGSEEARVGIEFIALSDRDRSRLLQLFDLAARSGT